ncbi:MAG: D-tyrosyl-tRNA(Tyr) deacylase [Alphaproteobacteria bacterium]|nr:D-tyrosyl-tRNA(Tyr) deacylase [Alphaproteobacteria bacterium]
MKALLQRVSQASVNIDGKSVSAVGKGLLILLGVEKGDTETCADYLARKAADLRIFEDENGKMNLSVKDVQGEVLVVSQFTLAGDTSHGNRPGFGTAARPEDANLLYQYFCNSMQKHNLIIKTGIFQADMQVSLINDGPVTFMLEKTI